MWSLNVYDSNDKIIKTVKAKEIDLTFGTVRKLSKIFEFENIENTHDIVKIILGSWEILTDILEKIFPGMTDEDWDGVKVNELIPLIIEIAKHAVTKALTIPANSKN